MIINRIELKEDEQCPFCGTEVKKGHSVCPGCNAEYGYEKIQPLSSVQAKIFSIVFFFCFMPYSCFKIGIFFGTGYSILCAVTELILFFVFLAKLQKKKQKKVINTVRWWK